MQGRLLIIDDDEDTVEMLALLLTHRGFEVQGSTDPAAALSSAIAELPAAILCDASMPRMSGFEFLSRLRHEPGPASRLPVFLMSGSCAPTDIERALHASFDGFLSKPLDLPLLMDTLHRCQGPADHGTPSSAARDVH